MADGAESGALLRGEDGRWEARRVHPGADQAVGDRIRLTIHTRMARLPSETRRGLELLAVGEPLGLDLAERLVGARLLGDVERRGLVRRSGGDDPEIVRLTHPLYGEALRARCPRARQRLIARQLVDAADPATIDPVRLALWRLRAGDVSDPRGYVIAARTALSIPSPSLALRLVRAGVRAGAGYEAELTLATALSAQDEGEEAEQAFARLSPADEQQLVVLTLARWRNLYWTLRRGDQAAELLRDAEEQVHDPDLRDELTATRLQQATLAARYDEALALAPRILERPGASERARVRAATALVPSLTAVGRPRAAVAEADAWLPIAGAHAAELPFAAYGLIRERFVALLLGGELAVAATEARQARTAALHEGRHLQAALWGVALGAAWLMQGRRVAGRNVLREAMAVLETTDPIGVRGWGLALLAEAEAMVGDVSEARRALLAAERAHAGETRSHLTNLGIARMEIATAEGRPSEALRHAHEAAELGRSSGHRLNEAHALHELVRHGRPGPARARLDSLAAQSDSPLVAGYALHAEGLCAHDGDRLDRASACLSGVGAQLLAAEASWEAAEEHRRRGRGPLAARSAAMARELAARCEGAHTGTLAWLDVDADHTVLTGRQKEVAELAARGLTSAQIAEGLGLSARTVDNHLAQAYRRLGVDGREELGSLLGR